MLGFGMPGTLELLLILQMFAGLSGVIACIVLVVWYFRKKTRTANDKPRLWMDVVLFLGVVVLAPGSFKLLNYIVYRSGLNMSWWVFTGIECDFLYLVSLLLGIVLLVRLLVLRKNLSRTGQGIRVVMILISLSIMFVSPQIHTPQMHFIGFRDRMKEQADIESIRSWLAIVDEAQDYSGFKNQSELPDIIMEMYPKYVNTYQLENGEGFKVRLTWGSGFGHWGIEVGSEDMAIPETEIDPYDKSGEYRERLADGAYIWYEVQPGDYVIGKQ